LFYLNYFDKFCFTTVANVQNVIKSGRNQVCFLVDFIWNDL